MQKITFISIISILFLTACNYSTKDDGAFPTDDIHVETNSSSKYDYNGKTYQWAGSALIISDPNGKWVAPGFDFKTFSTSTIKQELANQGLKESDKSADIIIAYGIGFDMAALKIKEYTDMDAKLMFKVPTGALTILIVNKKNNDILWMASAEGEYKKLATDVAKKRVEYAIAEMFKKFPG